MSASGSSDLTQAIEKAEREHHALLELSREGNADAACQLLERHILEACEGISAVLEGRAQASQAPNTAHLPHQR